MAEMLYPKLVRQLTSHPKCKICNHPQRGYIEDVIALQKMGRLIPPEMAADFHIPEGTRPTLDWIEKEFLNYIGMRLTRDNVRMHLKHAEVITADLKGVAADLQAKAERGEITYEGYTEYLEKVVAASGARVDADPSKVSTADGLRAAAILAQMRGDERKTDLMGMLAGAIGKVISPKPETPAIEAQAEEVVDAEVVDEETES